MSETLESLRGSFNRSLRVEGKADRALVLYGQSIDYFSRWLAISAVVIVSPLRASDSQGLVAEDIAEVSAQTTPPRR